MGMNEIYKSTEINKRMFDKKYSTKGAGREDTPRGPMKNYGD